MEPSWKWENIIRSPAYPKIRGLYGDRFPEVIRELVAQFFEENFSFLDWNAEHPTRDEANKIFQFAQGLANELRQSYNGLPTQTTAERRYKEFLHSCYVQVYESLQEDPYGMFKIVSKAIREEGSLLLESSQDAMAMCVDEQDVTMTTEDKIYSELEIALQLCVTSPGTAIKAVVDVCATVISALDQFRDNQRFTPILVTKEWNSVANLEESPDELRHFESWFTSLAKCITKLKEANLCTEELTNLENEMIRNCVVFEKHPRQIIRTDTAIGQVIVRVLPFTQEQLEIAVCPYFLNGDEASTWEEIASGINVEEGTLGSGKVTNAPFYNGRIVTWEKMSVDNVRRGKRRNVTSELFWLCVRVRLSFGGKLQHASAFSLPISVTSHNNQEAESWPYIVWYNAFPIRENSFGANLPDEVSWKRLVGIINQDFIKIGRGLTTAQKEYLKSKLIRDSNSDMVQRNEFCTKHFSVLYQTCKKRPLNDVSPNQSSSSISDEAEESSKSSKMEKERDISFGAWLGYCINVLNPTQKNCVAGLSELWRDGKIIGFMGTQETVRILSAQTAPVGSFIIKFPEQITDRLGLYFSSEEPSEVGEYLVKLAFSRDDLKHISIEERLSGNFAALYLYSDYEFKGSCFVHKEDAFKTKSSAKTVRPDKRGYFRPTAKVMAYISSTITNRISGILGRLKS